MLVFLYYEYERRLCFSPMVNLFTTCIILYSYYHVCNHVCMQVCMYMYVIIMYITITGILRE